MSKIHALKMGFIARLLDDDGLKMDYLDQERRLLYIELLKVRKAVGMTDIRFKDYGKNERWNMLVDYTGLPYARSKFKPETIVGTYYVDFKRCDLSWIINPSKDLASWDAMQVIEKLYTRFVISRELLATWRSKFAESCLTPEDYA